MGTIEIQATFDHGDLYVEVIAEASIYKDEGTYDTPPYTEFNYRVLSIETEDENGVREEVKYSKVKTEFADLIDYNVEREIEKYLN